MRNRLFVLFTAAACIAVASHRVSAQGGNIIKPEVQTGFLVGPIGGINLVAYNSSAFPILNLEPTCFQAENGSDVAAWGGISFEFPMGNPNELQNFIVGEVLYNSFSSKFSNAANESAPSIPTKVNGVEAPGSVTTALTASLAYLEVNLAYKYNFTPGPSPVGPGIQVGPVVGIKMTANYNKTVTVTAVSTAPGATTGDQMTEAVSATTADDNAGGLRVALRAAATYDISFSNEWIATPIVGYDFPITKVDPTNNWRSSALFAGIAFRYFIKG